MSNLSVERKNDGTRLSLVREPMRLMRELLSWDPFSQMSALWGSEGGQFMPAFEIKETKDAIVFKADLPGVKESDLNVSVSQNRLTISGKREEEKSDKSDKYYTYERSFGSFSRSFTLPEGVDDSRVAAELTQGVLTVKVPKQPQAEAKKVEVKAR